MASGVVRMFPGQCPRHRVSGGLEHRTLPVHVILQLLGEVEALTGGDLLSKE